MTTKYLRGTNGQSVPANNNRASTKATPTTTMKSGFTSSYRDKWTLTDTRCDPIYPRPETKYLDTPLGQLPPATPGTPYAVPLAGSIWLINALGQNVTGFSRVGQQVATKSIFYQYFVRIGEVTVPCVCRVLLFWDRTPNAVNPAVADVLSNPGNGVVSPLNLANRDRFVILADERLTLSPNGDTSKSVEGYRRINQLSTYADGQAAPRTGGLFVLLISDENLTNYEPLIVGTWRVRFADN